MGGGGCISIYSRYFTDTRFEANKSLISVGNYRVIKSAISVSKLVKNRDVNIFSVRDYDKHFQVKKLLITVENQRLPASLLFYEN